MKLNSTLCLSCTVLALGALSAQATVLTSSAAFALATNPDRTLDAFTAGDGNYALGYTVAGTYGGKVNSAGGGMERWNNVLFTSAFTDSITIDTFTGGVNAIGANFFITDGSTASGQSGFINITVSYSDITSESVTAFAVTDATTYRGFVAPSGATISSLVFSGAGGFNFNTIDNLSLGTAVPEPSQWGLFLGGGLMLFGAYRRFRK